MTILQTYISSAYIHFRVNVCAQINWIDLFQPLLGYIYDLRLLCHNMPASILNRNDDGQIRRYRFGSESVLAYYGMFSLFTGMTATLQNNAYISIWCKYASRHQNLYKNFSTILVALYDIYCFHLGHMFSGPWLFEFISHCIIKGWQVLKSTQLAVWSYG